VSAILVRPASQIPARSDVELLARVVSGEIGALGELYDRYARDVWRVAQRMLGNADDAEDVVHLVFMKLPQIAASHDGRSNVRSWLLGVTVRIASRQRRGAGRFVKMIASFAQALSGVSQTDPERVVGAREELRAFETELAKLSPRKRDVFMLVEIEGLTSDEAARALGVPAATVRTRLHHARHQLAGSLSERDSREGGNHD